MKTKNNLISKSFSLILLMLPVAQLLFADGPSFGSGLDFMKEKKSIVKGYVEEGFDYAMYMCGGVLVFTLVKIGYGKFKGRETDGTMVGWAFGTGITLLAFEAIRFFFLK